MGPPTHPTLHTYRILLDIQTSRQSTLFQCLSTVVRWWAIFGPLLLGARGEAMSRKLWQNFRIKSFAFQTALFGNHHRTSVGDFRQTVELESTRTKYAPLWAHVPSMYPCVHGFTKDGKFGNKTLNRIDFCTPKIILIKILPSSFFSANFEEGNFHVSRYLMCRRNREFTKTDQVGEMSSLSPHRIFPRRFGEASFTWNLKRLYLTWGGVPGSGVLWNVYYWHWQAPWVAPDLLDPVLGSHLTGSTHPTPTI